MKKIHMGSSHSKKEPMELFLGKSRRITRGCRPVIECFQEIPCNICELVCHSGGIKIGFPLSNIPVFDTEHCTGCGLCVVACPGLAIFLTDPDFSETEALVSLPYEFLPEPKVGEVVSVVNQRGKVVGNGRVLEVRRMKTFDSTLLVTVVILKQLVQEVRGIKMLVGGTHSEE